MSCIISVFDVEGNKVDEHIVGSAFDTIREDILKWLHTEGTIVPGFTPGKFDVYLHVLDEYYPDNVTFITTRQIEEMIDYRDPTDKYKVVACSNYDRDEFDEGAVQEYLNCAQAYIIAAEMNADLYRVEEYYYKVKPQTYILRVGPC